MRQAAFAGILVSAVLFFTPLAYAYTSPGAPRGYVNDFAGVLSAGTVSSLDAELTQFEKETSNEITVVTVPNMGGDYIEHYAVKLFEEWGIGKKDRDNGVLLLLSIEEHKLRIEVGYGLEGALPDSVAGRILSNEMAPLLRKNDYDGAVTAGVHAIQSATKGEYQGGGPGNDALSVLSETGSWIALMVIFLIQFFASVFARSKSWWAGGIVGGIAGALVWFFAHLTGFFAVFSVLGLAGVGLLLDYIVSRGYQHARAVGKRPPWWAGGTGGITGGRGGGGFGGFGGGSSGGGGASGSW